MDKSSKDNPAIAPEKGLRLLGKNIIALSWLQLVEFLIPILTLPYITRTLGVDAYGQVIYVQVTMGVGALLINFGFPWSATRRVASVKESIDAVSSVYTSTMCAQGILFLALMPVFIVSLVLVPPMRENQLLFIAGLLPLVGNIVFPSWLFSGLERIRIMAQVHICVRLAALPFIFWLINGPSDSLNFLLISGFSSLVAACVAQVLIHRLKLAKLVCLNRNGLLSAFREGSAYFWSTLFISMYTAAIPIILGNFAGHVALSYYSIADKVRGAAQAIISPITASMYPRVSGLYETNRAGAIELLRRLSPPLFLLSLVISSILFVYADTLVFLLGGEEFAKSVPVLKVMAFIPLWVSISNVFGVQVLLATGRTRIVNITAGLVGTLTFLASFLMVYYFEHMGAAMCLFCAELTVSIVYMYAVVFPKK